jgi:hypothetical protein
LQETTLSKFNFAYSKKEDAVRGDSYIDISRNKEMSQGTRFHSKTPYDSYPGPLVKLMAPYLPYTPFSISR